MDPPLAPTVRGPGCPPAPPSDNWYGGLGVSLGDSEAWKPQKVGGCGWTRCPRNSVLSHVAQDTARAWFRGVGAHCADFGAFRRLFGHHKWSGIIFGKTRFDPFLTHCWSQNGPFSRHFGIFHGPKRATTGSKRPKNTCLTIPSGLGTTLEKNIFFARGTLVDPPLAPTVRGLAGPPAPPSDHWYGALRVSLGNSEAWKP